MVEDRVSEKLIIFFLFLIKIKTVLASKKTSFFIHRVRFLTSIFKSNTRSSTVNRDSEATLTEAVDSYSRCFY